MGIFTSDAKVVYHGVLYLRTYSIDALMVCFVFCLNGFFQRLRPHRLHHVQLPVFHVPGAPAAGDLVLHPCPASPCFRSALPRRWPRWYRSSFS